MWTFKVNNAMSEAQLSNAAEGFLVRNCSLVLLRAFLN